MTLDDAHLSASYWLSALFTELSPKDRVQLAEDITISMAAYLGKAGAPHIPTLSSPADLN